METKNIKLLSLFLFTGLVIASCTDLTDSVEDGIGREVVEGGESDIGDPAAALTGVYAQLRELRGAGGTFALMSHPSDEMMGPTRGTDWSDFGVWRQLHAHTWDPSHAQVLNAWNHLNSGVFRATQVASATTSTPEQVAEARFLRAFFMFYVMDLYGQVPFREPDAAANEVPSVMNRSTAFDVILNDLDAARPGLPNLSSGVDAGRASQEAVDFLTARMYLNRAVYMNSTPEEPSAGPFSFEGADMDEVISRVQNIIDNPYTELTDYWNNFHWNNTDLSSELIFVNSESPGAATNFTTFAWTLHYNHSPTGCCNGFTTVTDFYNRFTDEADIRRGAYIPEMSASTGIMAGFLEGQQYDSFDGPENPGNLLSDRGGNPLIFTPEVDLFYSNERMGVRVIKYLVNPEQPTQPGTDFIFFRYADALLMKAEAHHRNGQSGEALDIINELRTNRGASELQSIDEEAILNERGYEMYWEGWRRHDQIRFGVFTSEWDQKPLSDDHRVMFPIPQRALDTNPNLVQISGY